MATFEDLLPTQVVVLGLDLVLTRFGELVAFGLAHPGTENDKNSLQPLPHFIGLLDRIHQAHILLRYFQVQLQSLGVLYFL